MQKPARIRRHVWHERDYCITCGVRRDGYPGGRTGSLRYTWPDGRVTLRAGECLGLPATMRPECGGPYNMAAPDGPVCSCGEPSRHESGWCGRSPQ
jgi:hypothetical protein